MPPAGSSSMISFGSSIRICASSTSFCWPKESAGPARRGTSASRRSRAAPRRARPRRRKQRRRRAAPRRNSRSGATTFSSTVISRNRRVIWNVRPRPRCARRQGGLPSIRSPVEPDLAGLGRHRAADQVEDGGLAGAVGPDQRRDRALGTVNDAPSTARTPPKLLLEPLHLEQRPASGGGRAGAGAGRAHAARPPVSRSPTSPALPRARQRSIQPLGGGNDAPRHEQHDERQQAAEDQQPGVPAAELVVAGLVEPLDDERAEHRPPDVAARRAGATG